MSTLPPDFASSPAASGTDHDALPPGTRFGEFEILRVLGVGGFGIVYLANDHSLEREVALKEYMPASLAARGAGPQITVRSSSFAETYAIGLRSFVNEARLLARFDHPSLVKVYRFWEDNATAYMVMPFLQGVTLRDTRRRMAHPPDEAWIRSVISPILSALELLHREGVYHRDIAPDNILLPPDGPPVLLDFGAARRVISDRTQSLTAILKPSYAPIEQYAEMTQLRQGPWTDLYALGAVIHYLLFGAPPAPATARAVQDDTEAIENRIVPGVSPRFLEAVSWMLSIRPNQRPQNGEQLRAVLDGNAQIPPRGRPGITIPPNVAISPAINAYPPAQPPGPAQRHEVETAADATFINTAHIPTHMPTAHAPPPGQTRAPPTTSFSPTAQMPTARPPPPATTFDRTMAVPPPQTMAPRAPPPGQEGASAQWPASRPSTLPPPSRPAPLTAHPVTATQQPVPLAAAALPAAAKPGGSKAWMVLAGVVGVVVIAGAAAWQFAGKRDGGGTDPTVGAASAAAAVPTVPVAAVPVPAPTAPTATAVPTAAATDPAATSPTTTATTLPDASRPVPVPPPARPATTTARTDLPVDAGSKPPVPDRTTAATNTVDRPTSAASSAASLARARPVGQPVPRQRESETAITGTPTYPSRPADTSTGYNNGNANNPPPSSYNTGNPNDRPRPLGQSNVRDPVPIGRPVPPQPSQQQQQPQQTAQVQGPATSARDACGKRVFIALALCMEEKCDEARFRGSAECVAILDRKRARESR
jgi:serine/threonine protein kinase